MSDDIKKFTDRVTDRTAKAQSLVKSRAKIGKLAELLEEHEIDLDEIGSIERINLYQQGYKDNDGVGHVQTLAAIQIDPSWKSGPQWPVVDPAPPRTVKTPPVKAKKNSGLTAMVLPDIQAGFFRTPNGTLVPTHDPRALDIVLRIAKELRPDVIVMHGDNLDFPELSTKYRLSPAFVQTTQSSIDFVSEFGFQLRSVAPEAEFYWLAGNHEERLPNYILDNAGAAFGLKRAQALPDHWPVLSVPFLTRMDEWGCTFLPGYPANEYWLNERLRIIHGNKVRSGSPVAHLYLEDARHSTFYGHIHRREWAERTRQSYDGPKTIAAGSAGCLCRTDGAVPSVKQGIDLNGLPISSAEDWQQGFFVVQYEPGDSPFYTETVRMDPDNSKNLVGRFRGNSYLADASLLYG